MSDRTGYLYDARQTAALRREWVRDHLLPALRPLFARLPALRSACVLVAQYWDDEANDAVHCRIVVSELETPDLAAASRAEVEPDDGDPVNLPTLHALALWDDRLEFRASAVTPYTLKIPWSDNNDAISLWAAYAPDGGSQLADGLEAYAPALLITRDDDDDLVTHESWPMRRPWLDGVRPLWSGG
jgi:hypothetical protein